MEHSSLGSLRSGSRHSWGYVELCHVVLKTCPLQCRGLSSSMLSASFPPDCSHFCPVWLHVLSLVLVAVMDLWYVYLASPFVICFRSEWAKGEYLWELEEAELCNSYFVIHAYCYESADSHSPWYEVASGPTIVIPLYPPLSFLTPESGMCPLFHDKGHHLLQIPSFPRAEARMQDLVHPRGGPAHTWGWQPTCNLFCLMPCSAEFKVQHTIALQRLLNQPP